MIERVQRTKSLDYLMPRLRQRVLATTLLHPDRKWYLRELAAKISVTPSSLQKELQNLVAAGILTRNDSGNRAYFQADLSSPLFPDLQSLLKKSVGAVDLIREALTPWRSQIDAVFIYGSFAGSAIVRNSSDIDLMVLGTIDGADLSDALLDVETTLGREVNPTLYTAKEFKEKLANGNHFLMTVVRSERLPILGNLDDLAATPD